MGRNGRKKGMGEGNGKDKEVKEGRENNWKTEEE